MKHKILFVCLGNICRSSTAEGFEYVIDILEDACAGLLTSLTLDN